MTRRVLAPLLVFTLLISITLATPCAAQGRKPTASELRALDIQAEKAEQDYLKSLVELATQYESAGEIERSKAVLRQILRIKPDVESIKNKLKQYDEEVFQRNTWEVELDVSRGWTPAGVAVTRDQTVRIQAAGTYRIIINQELGPDGYRTNESSKDFVSGIPTGALIGMIAPAQRQRNQPEPTPFLIGTSLELKPRETGILFLRVNSPPQAKNTGKLKVRLSGNFSR